ncbi:hypothetical protein RCL1_005096 [Eukaryota sp. TZLM3-RCL]
MPTRKSPISTSENNASAFPLNLHVSPLFHDGSNSLIHQQTPRHARPSLSQSRVNSDLIEIEPFFLPQVCLQKGLFLLILKMIEERSLGFDVAAVAILHFGNISKRFRDIVIVSATKVFQGRTVLKHQFKSPFVKRFLSRGIISSMFADYEFVSPNSNIEYNDINACSLNFIKSCNKIASYDFSRYKLLRHLEVDARLLDNSHSFPSQLSPLLSLQISGCPTGNANSFSVDIRELKNLTSFHIKSFGTVTGLSYLTLLKKLKLSKLINCDGIHPLAKIEEAEYEELEQDCLEILFQNPDNYQFCELSLVQITIPTSAEWIKTSILSSYTPQNLSSNEELYQLFSRNDLQLLKRLCLAANYRSFGSNNRFDNFDFDTFCDSLSTFHHIPILYIQSLELKGVGHTHFHKILRSAPFIKELYLDDVSFVDGENLCFDQLKRLKKLEVTQVVGLFSKLSCLPKLSSLRLSNVNDFHFDHIPFLFPNLERLSLLFCVIRGFAQPNSTIKTMLLANCEVSNGYYAISQFKNLKYLAANCILPQFVFDLQVPDSLNVLKCVGEFPALCPFLNVVHPSCSISLKIRTSINSDEQDSLQLESWLSNYRLNRRTLYHHDF